MFTESMRRGWRARLSIAGVILALTIFCGAAIPALAAAQPESVYELEYSIIDAAGGRQTASDYELLFSLQIVGVGVGTHTSADYTITNVFDFAEDYNSVFWYLH